MSYLSLDLSLSSTGYSVFSDDGKLLTHNKVVPDKGLDNATKIHFIVGKLKELFTNVDMLLIEDLYVNLNPKAVIWLARLSGGVIFSWMDTKYKAPKLYQAIQARPLAGIKGNAHKAEIQMFILEKYKKVPYAQIKKYKTEFNNLKAQYSVKKLTKSQYNYAKDKLSLQIETETGLGEDEADSIIIGLAYATEVKRRRR